MKYIFRGKRILKNKNYDITKNYKSYEGKKYPSLKNQLNDIINNINKFFIKENSSLFKSTNYFTDDKERLKVTLRVISILKNELYDKKDNQLFYTNLSFIKYIQGLINNFFKIIMSYMIKKVSEEDILNVISKKTSKNIKKIIDIRVNQFEHIFELFDNQDIDTPITIPLENNLITINKPKENTKDNQIENNQIKDDKTKDNQIKDNLTEPNQTEDKIEINNLKLSTDNSTDNYSNSLQIKNVDDYDNENYNPIINLYGHNFNNNINNINNFMPVIIRRSEEDEYNIFNDTDNDSSNDSDTIMKKIIYND